jgi:hypothetical protein
MEREKRDGTYKTAVNMQDDDEEEEEGEQGGRRKRTKKAPIVCPHCGKKGHKTTATSKKCLRHVPKNAAGVAAATTPAAMAEEEVDTSTMINNDFRGCC